MLVDLFLPGRHDPQGIDGEIIRHANLDTEVCNPDPAKPFVIAAYFRNRDLNVLREAIALGDELPLMPLYLDPREQIRLPLATTYDAAFLGMPQYWRDVLNAER